MKAQSRPSHLALLVKSVELAKPGAYQRAMEKRGPGLHHLAIDVLNIEEFLTSIAGSGWFLHPMSVKTITQSKTAYL